MMLFVFLDVLRSVGFSVGLSARSQFWLSVLSGLCLCRDQVSVSVLFCASIFF